MSQYVCTGRSISHYIPFKQRESDIDTDPGIPESKADITSID